MSFAAATISAYSSNEHLIYSLNRLSVLCPLEIYVQANFSIKQSCRCSHIHKTSGRKINEVNLTASCVLGHPKCFRRPKTTCRYPTLQSRADIMLFRCKYIRKRARYTKFILDISKRMQQVFEVYLKYTHFIRKFYSPNNHINYPNFHS